ncbi:hypothetical protein ACHAXS_010012 [Conticribra weissflogii]
MGTRSRNHLNMTCYLGEEGR